MRTRRWAEVEHKVSPERREAARLWAKTESARLELLEMNLKALRKQLGLTQEELAARLDMSQAQLSQTERRDDHLISTLRRYVEALGGDLEVVARFKDKRVQLVGV